MEDMLDEAYQSKMATIPSEGNTPERGGPPEAKQRTSYDTAVHRRAMLPFGKPRTKDEPNTNKIEVEEEQDRHHEE